MRRTAPTALALILALAGTAMAQEESAPPADDVLGGPSVMDEAADAPPTIVRRSFDGTLARPEGPPEMAALDALDLDEEARARVDDALAERNAAIDAILAEYLDLFSRTINLFQSGALGQRTDGANSGTDRRAAMQTMREVRTAVEPISERGTLREEISSALQGDHLTDFERMMEEWDEVIAADRGAGDGMRPQRERQRPQGRGGERFAHFGSLLQEFGSSYQRVIGQRVEDYRALLEGLDVDAETKGVIEAAVQGMLSEDYDDEEQRSRLFREIMDGLTDEQRRQLMSELRRVRPEGMGAGAGEGRRRGR